MKQLLFKYINNLKLIFGLYKKVEFNNLSSIKPVSRLIGTDRGKPIDRYYIEKFLSGHQTDIKGRILEIADDVYSRKYTDKKSGEKVIFETMHVDGNETASMLVGDLTKPGTLPKDRYDCFICTQTFNFIYDVKLAIEGTYQLLKDGGIVLATVAGISQISRYDMDRWGDYWRFTDKSVMKLFEDVFGKDHIEVTVYGNVMATTAFLQGLAVEDLPNPSLLDEPDLDYQMIIGIRAKKNTP